MKGGEKVLRTRQIQIICRNILKTNKLSKWISYTDFNWTTFCFVVAQPKRENEKSLKILAAFKADEQMKITHIHLHALAIWIIFVHILNCRCCRNGPKAVGTIG